MSGNNECIFAQNIGSHRIIDIFSLSITTDKMSSMQLDEYVNEQLVEGLGS